MRNKVTAMFALMFLFASTIWAEEAKKPAPPPPPTYETFSFQVLKVGDSIKSFPLKEINGNQKDLMSLAVKGVPMVVFFTNSTCAACRAEASLLASLKADLKEKITLVGVLTDLSDKGYTSLEKSVQESATFLHDPEFKSPPAFGFAFTPALIVIKDGKIVAEKGGYNPAADGKVVAELVTKNL